MNLALMIALHPAQHLLIHGLDSYFLFNKCKKKTKKKKKDELMER